MANKSDSRKKFRFVMSKNLIVVLVVVAIATGLGTGACFLYKHYYVEFQHK